MMIVSFYYLFKMSISFILHTKQKVLVETVLVHSHLRTSWAQQFTRTESSSLISDFRKYGTVHEGACHPWQGQVTQACILLMLESELPKWVWDLATCPSSQRWELGSQAHYPWLWKSLISFCDLECLQVRQSPSLNVLWHLQTMMIIMSW